MEGRITVEQVADDLSLLADSVLRVTAQWCWSRLRNRHRETPQFGIIAYGKLGGKELGYGSDLDIVFVFDDDDERAPEIYAAFVRKLINWLTVKTGEGICSRSTPSCAPTATRAAGHQLRRLRQLPAAARQQHRLDLGTPGHDAARFVLDSREPRWH